MASPVVLRRSARLSAKPSPAPTVVCSPSSSPEREVIVKKRRKEKVSVLANQVVISPKRGKISTYFSKIVSGENRKTKVKGKKVAVEETSQVGNKISETRSEIEGFHEVPCIPPRTSGEETQVLVKHERLLKKGPSRDMEAELWEMGFQHFAGVDEAGRGPLAGPVVAAACIIPSHISIDGINDSKKLTEERREELYSKLTTTPGITFAVHVIDAPTKSNHYRQRTMLAMAACVKQLNSVEDGLPCPDFVLVDGNRLPSDMPETGARSVVKGDALCHVIAAASILAKVTRDRLMIAYDEYFSAPGHPIYFIAAHSTDTVQDHFNEIVHFRSRDYQVLGFPGSTLCTFMRSPQWVPGVPSKFLCGAAKEVFKANSLGLEAKEVFKANMSTSCISSLEEPERDSADSNEGKKSATTPDATYKETAHGSRNDDPQRLEREETKSPATDVPKRLQHEEKKSPASDVPKRGVENIDDVRAASSMSPEIAYFPQDDLPQSLDEHKLMTEMMDDWEIEEYGTLLAPEEYMAL